MTGHTPQVVEVVELFERFGSSNYDEGVSLTDHCLQTAALAKHSGASDELVAASLLHDVGHLLQAKARGNEDYLSADWHHDAVAARWLKPRFGAAVAEPVGLHVAAKRWLCSAEPAYLDQLSSASVASLHAQGGVFNLEEALAWRTQPGVADAIQLRRWDDGGKTAGATVEPLDVYLPMLDQMAKTR